MGFKQFICQKEPLSKEFDFCCPAPLFRRKFEVKEGLEKATLLVCALGMGEIYFNGKPLTKGRFLTPFSNYEKTLWYNVFDVTHLLVPGHNVAAAALGNGFYNESLNTPWNFNEAEWRDVPKLLFKLDLFYEDSVETVLSDTEWVYSIDCSPFRFNEFRFGEIYDTHFAIDWMNPDFDDSTWERVQIAKTPKGILRQNPCPAIIEKETLKCINLFQTQEGDFVFDFGRNVSGYVNLRLNQPDNTQIAITYAEDITAEGKRLDNDLERYYYDGKTQTMTVISNGKDTVFKPCFSYYGFRYVIVSGFKNEPDINDIEAIFVHQDVEDLSEFRCSNETLNKIFKCTKHSTLCNLFNMPTDCPTREKLGWCNDASASAEQMVQNFRLDRLYDKWMQDVLDAMKADGNLPGIVPTADWGYDWGNGLVSTAVLFEIPFRIWQYRNNDILLKLTFEAQKMHLKFFEDKIDSETGLISFGLGDWSGPDTDESEPVSVAFISTLLMIKCLKILSLTAEIMGDKKTKEMADEGRINLEKRFKKIHFMPDGSLKCNRQTALSMVIAIGVYDDLKPLKKQLIESCLKTNFHLDVGMVGIQYILPALDICNLPEYGFNLLTADGYPSYKYWFDMGTDTLFEKWDAGYSRNHHMFSCVETWLHNTVLGIKFENSLKMGPILTVCPKFLEKLSFAFGSFKTEFGKISVSWERKDKEIHLSVKAPKKLDIRVLGNEGKLCALKRGKDYTAVIICN